MQNMSLSAWLCLYIGLPAVVIGALIMGATGMHVNVAMPISIGIVLVGWVVISQSKKGSDSTALPPTVNMAVDTKQENSETHPMFCTRCHEETAHYILVSPGALQNGVVFREKPLLAVNHFYLVCPKCNTPSKEISRVQAQAFRKCT